MCCEHEGGRRVRGEGGGLRAAQWERFLHTLSSVLIEQSSWPACTAAAQPTR
jgi:hypothetical protein